MVFAEHKVGAAAGVAGLLKVIYGYLTCRGECENTGPASQRQITSLCWSFL